MAVHAFFSRSRARLIAKLLTDRADVLERTDPGMRCIDEEGNLNA